MHKAPPVPLRGDRILPAAVCSYPSLRPKLVPLIQLRLCHLIVSIDNESMALEEFIIDLCEESVTGALRVRGTPVHMGGNH